MHQLHAAALDFASAVHACRNPRAVLDLLHRRVSRLGPGHPQLQVYGIYRLEPTPDGPDDYVIERNSFLHSSLPPRYWSSFKRGFRANGPSVLNRLAREGRPFTITEAMRQQRPSGTDRWIFDCFSKFTIRDGFCCPVLPWAVLYWSKQVLHLSREERASLRFMAKHAAERIDEMRPAKKKKQRIKLTRREEAVLNHIAEGETDEEIAERLGIKLTSVRYYFEGAQAKLNAKNRTHAVVLAMQRGLIKQ
jgi:DNA-binding CsgD family transcriptional regulator